MNRIYSINGPVVKIKGATELSMMEKVYVGKSCLIGEVIGITSEATTIQVYESTTGLRAGEEIRGTGAPMCVTLAPGIMSNIYDGIQRPLKAVENESGAFIGTL